MCRFWAGMSRRRTGRQQPSVPEKGPRRRPGRRRSSPGASRGSFSRRQWVGGRRCGGRGRSLGFLQWRSTGALHSLPALFPPRAHAGCGGASAGARAGEDAGTGPFIITNTVTHNNGTLSRRSRGAGGGGGGRGLIIPRMCERARARSRLSAEGEGAEGRARPRRPDSAGAEWSPAAAAAAAGGLD